METTVKTAKMLWFAVTGVLAVLFWAVGCLWLNWLYHDSDDPGFGFILFLGAVLITFGVRIHRLRPQTTTTLQHHVVTFLSTVLAFAAWFGIGILIICYFPT